MNHTYLKRARVGQRNKILTHQQWPNVRKATSSTPCPCPVTGLPTGARILPSMPTTNLQPLLTVLQALNKNQEAAKITQTKSVNTNVKIINPAKKNMSETYVLCGVGSNNVANPTQLREQILRQFGSELVSSKADFAIGYQKGTSKV